MLARRSMKISLPIVFGLLIAALTAGCLETDKTVAARYDKDKDLFSFLVVFQRIRGGVAGSSDQNQSKYDPAVDLKYLAALYENRDHLILSPVGSPWPLEDFGEDAMLRLSASLGARVNLSAAQPTLHAFKSPVALDGVKILPGAFFLRGEGNLCYYHQMVVPGSVVDAALAAANDGLKQSPPADPLKALDEELDRRKRGEDRVGWDEFQSTTIAQVLSHLDRSFGDAKRADVKSADVKGAEVKGEANGEPPPDEKTPRIPLETSSIEGLRDSLLAGKVQVQRRGGELFVRATLGPGDVSGAVAYYAALRQAVDGKAASLASSHPGTAREPRALARFLDAVTVSAADKTTLEASVDVMKAFAAFDHPIDPLRDDDPEKAARAREMAALVDKKLEIDKAVTVEQVQRDFAAGTLTPHDPGKPAQPGEGLGEVEPPGQ